MKTPGIGESRLRIPHAWQIFLRLYFCFSVISCFSSTFLNTFLIRATGDSKGVMFFNIILAAVQPFVMLFSVKLMHKKGASVSQSVGMLLYAVSFLWLGISGEKAIPYIKLIAIMISAGNGFFFTTYALQLLDYANDDNRDACYGVQNALGSLIGIVLPTLTGILLSAFDDFSGYRVVFFIGLIVAGIAVFTALRLPPVTNMSPKVQFGKALRTLLRKKQARAAMFASMANGFYGGTMSFFLSILIYQIVQNEAVIGLTNTAGSIIAILSSMVYSRIVHPNNRLKVILFTVVIMMTACCCLLFHVTLATLIAFNLLLSALSGFFLNPPTVAYFGVVEHLPELQGLGSEVHALREFWYGLGRVLGIVMTLTLSDMQNGVGAVILIILGVQIIPAFLIKRMQITA